MFRTVLVVCVGNICRSPVGERLLAAGLPDLSVSSAGLGALVGHAADETTQEVAQAHSLSLEGHVARQFNVDLGQAQDLILVMEPGHKREIIRIAPHLSGKTMLFDQWTGGAGIADPYRRSREFHEHVFESISKAAETWMSRLGASKR